MIYLIRVFTALTTEERVEKYQHLVASVEWKIWQETNSTLATRLVVLIMVLLEIQVL